MPLSERQLHSQSSRPETLCSTEVVLWASTGSLLLGSMVQISSGRHTNNSMRPCQQIAHGYAARPGCNCGRLLVYMHCQTSQAAHRGSA